MGAKQSVTPQAGVPCQGARGPACIPRRAAADDGFSTEDAGPAHSLLPRQSNNSKLSIGQSSATPRRPIGVWSFDGNNHVEHSLAWPHRVPLVVEESPRGSPECETGRQCGRASNSARDRRSPRGSTPEAECEEAPAPRAQQSAAGSDQPLLGATDALLDRYGLLRLQIQGLEELNRQSLSRISDIFAPHRLSPDEEREEGTMLMMEVAVRRRHIIGMSTVLESLENELLSRGVDPLDQKACLDEVPEDPDVCQFCLTNPIGMEYECCRYRGACVDCAVTMREVAARCPHCRAELPQATPTGC